MHINETGILFTIVLIIFLGLMPANSGYADEKMQNRTPDGYWKTVPDDDESPSVIHIWIENGEKLKVRGFIGLSLLGRTQCWNKVPKPE